MNRRLSMIRLLCLSMLSGGVDAQPATHSDVDKPTAQSAGGPVAFTIGDDDHRFQSSGARGRYLAIHFLTGSESDTAFLDEYAKGEGTLAGISQIFVYPGSKEQLAAVVKIAPAGLADRLYADSERKLASLLHLETANAAATGGHLPATIILDPAGREAMREVGASDGERFRFAQFAAAIRKLSSDSQAQHANVSGGLSLQGYDPVAYIRQHTASKGNPKIASTYHGLTYRFVTEENRSLFNASPDTYLPAYGGWCATAMAKGEKVEIDPTHFKVTGGRTFLFYNGLWGDARKDWIKDEPGMTAKADAHWSALLAK
ncbi:MAG: hypothetical protein L6Q35_08110 [Phycisphaerales bacterium]|nr:hypothetical protein [Phycisphaerales bacterium]